MWTEHMLVHAVHSKTAIVSMQIRTVYLPNVGQSDNSNFQ